MQNSSSAKTFLVGGIIAGPLYLLVSLIESFAREGFDLTKHSLSLLSNGPMGWIHTLLFLITGLLVMGAAIGIRKQMMAGVGKTWGPLLLGLYGAGLMASGLFKADPSFGFPPGTPDGPPNPVTLSGTMHLVAGGIGFIGLIIACFVFARRFGKDGLRGWRLFSLVTGIVFLLGFMGIASGGGSGLTIFGFWIGVVLSWIWISLLSAFYLK